MQFKYDLRRVTAFYKKEKTVDGSTGGYLRLGGGLRPPHPPPVDNQGFDMLFNQQINPLSIIYVPVCLSIHVSLPRFYLMSLLSMHALLRC